jgi:hypothetical protein
MCQKSCGDKFRHVRARLRRTPENYVVYVQRSTVILRSVVNRGSDCLGNPVRLSTKSTRPGFILLGPTLRKTGLASGRKFPQATVRAWENGGVGPCSPSISSISMSSGLAPRQLPIATESRRFQVTRCHQPFSDAVDPAPLSRRFPPEGRGRRTCFHFARVDRRWIVKSAPYSLRSSSTDF